MRFPPEFIDRLRAQITVSQVVGRHVALKRHGREFQGLCPFHKEKTPSFTVNDDKGFYHCFGCGAHGDGIRFLTDYEGVPYPEAIERLAGEFGLSLPKMTEDQIRQIKRYDDLYDVMEIACKWFEAQLKSPDGKVAQDYLKSRGLTGKIAKHFRLGFSPQNREALKAFMTGQGISEDRLVEAGLIIRSDQGRSYDRFRGRVLFPITDRRGKIIAFGGRVIPALADTMREAPKYLNSPETLLFKKGEVLYGYEQARPAAHRAGTVLVTEGYMDVISLYRHGLAYAVAPLGTAVTEQHLRLLWQVTDIPVFCLDGDAAGQRAMLRAAELSLALLKPGKSLKFLILPKGEDPDTLVQKEGMEGFSARLKGADSLADVLWNYHKASLKNDNSPEKRASLEHKLMELADRITDSIVKSHFRAYFRKLLWPERKRTFKGKGQKIEELGNIRSRDVESFMKSGEQAQIRKREESLLRLIVQNPSLLGYGEVEEALGSFIFSNAVFDAIRQLIMDISLSYPELPRDILEKRAEGFPLSNAIAELYSAKKILPNEQQVMALQHWRLELYAHSLIRMKAECYALETEMAENMDEENYARLVALKKQIADMQKAMTALQTQLTL